MGAQPPTPEWGTMLAEAREFIQRAWWVVTFPGLAILITVVAINLMSGVQGRAPIQGSGSSRSPSGKIVRATLSARSSCTGVLGASSVANSAPVVRRMPLFIGARK